MPYSFLGLLQFVPLMVMLAAQWIGVLAMRHDRSGAWWTMLVGLVLISLGTLASILVFIDGFVEGGRMMWISILVGCHTLGGLVFACGFAMHGLRRKALRDHEQQLTAMAAAMAEELRVLRESQR